MSGRWSVLSIGDVARPNGRSGRWRCRRCTSSATGLIYGSRLTGAGALGTKGRAGCSA